MDLRGQFERTIAYDDWANREALASLRGARGNRDRGVRFLAHIVGAELIWQARVDGIPAPGPVWPGWGLEECAARLEAVRPGWRNGLRGDLDRAVSYVNSAGERHSSAVFDIVMHVMLHSAYHRGQVASALRATDDTPAITDYAHCTRLGLLR